jgi:hypothetical protein
MSICIERDLYVQIRQLGERPHPLPLQSGFSNDVAYRVLGLHSASETSEAYFILANDLDQTWFISNRHIAIVGVLSWCTALRMPLAEVMSSRTTLSTAPASVTENKESVRQEPARISA